jgi:hypothetical protein
MAYTLQGNKDCAIVSICNYTGKSYDEVMEAALFANLTPEKVAKSGTPDYAVVLILLKLTGRVWTMHKPRRGQEKINGLVSFHQANRSVGHMVAVVDGHVYDTDGMVLDIKSYAARYSYHVRMVYS